MEKSMFNHSRDGLPEMGGGEMEAFGKERYEDLLREAEEYRLEQRALAKKQPSRHNGRSPLVHLLMWLGI